MSQYSVPGEGSGSDAPVRDLTDVDVGELKIVTACCCAISSLFTKFPDCCGCKSEGKFLCLQEEMICCKPISAANADNVCCCRCSLSLSLSLVIHPVVCLSIPATYLFVRHHQEAPWKLTVEN